MKHIKDILLFFGFAIAALAGKTAVTFCSPRAQKEDRLKFKL